MTKCHERSTVSNTRHVLEWSSTETFQLNLGNIGLNCCEHSGELWEKRKNTFMLFRKSEWINKLRMEGLLIDFIEVQERREEIAKVMI